VILGGFTRASAFGLNRVSCLIHLCAFIKGMVHVSPETDVGGDMKEVDSFPAEEIDGKKFYPV
jgi:hypothetical protein